MTTLLIFALVLQLLDGLTTHRILSRLKGRELNSVVDRLIERLGLVGGLVVAKGIVSLAVLVAYWLESGLALGVLVAGYTVVVGHNLFSIYGATK